MKIDATTGSPKKQCKNNTDAPGSSGQKGFDAGVRILLLADFRSDSARFLLNNSRIFSKGFIRNGHDVYEFGYRDMMLRLSPIKSKKWAVKLAKNKTDKLLAKMARSYQPDIVFITAFKLLDADTIRQLREAAPQAVFMCWYGDPPRGIDANVPAIAKLCDWFLATSGGELLQTYKQMGIAHCAFMPNPSDPDIEHPRQVPPQWKSKLLFTGKLTHNRRGRDSLRWELIRLLMEKKKMTVWGCLGRPSVEGDDYIQALCGAGMALSINVCNDVRFYHSDRLTHLLGCGTFTLARNVPDSELLFEDQKHLCYFDSTDECLEIVDRYEKDEAGRGKIARQGMKRAHEMFNCEKLASYIIDLARGQEFNEPWAQII